MSQTQVVFEAVIVYANLTEPKPYVGVVNSDPKYSAKLIVTDQRYWPTIKAAYATAVAEKFGPTPPEDLKTPIKSCNYAPLEGKGMISVTAYPDTPPEVYFPDMTMMPAAVRAQQIFHGCKVKVAVNFRGYTTGSKGVRANLNIVQLMDNVNIVKVEVGVDAESLGFAPNPNAPTPVASTPGDPASFMPQSQVPAQQGFYQPPVQQQAPAQQQPAQSMADFLPPETSAPAPRQQQAPVQGEIDPWNFG